MTAAPVLFYTHTARAFRATLIGFLSELSMERRVILLSERLDPETEKSLADKKWFPGLEAIVSVGQFSGGEGLMARNLRLRRLADRVISESHPSAVVAASDMHSFFELCLFRAAKKAGSLNICVQPTLSIENTKVSVLIERTNAELRLPHWLPLGIRVLLVRVGKLAGHMLQYWVFPLLAGTLPFPGPSSFVLRRGNSGMRDSHVQIVLSERDYRSWLSDGADPGKLFIVDHPLKRGMTELFASICGPAAPAASGKTALLLLPSDIIGIRSAGLTVVGEKERLATWSGIIKAAREALPDWNIIIKPHPDAVNLEPVKKICEELSPPAHVADRNDPVEKFLPAAAVVVDLPRSATTVLWTASMKCEGKRLISLDFDGDLCGDVFRDFSGVEYITSLEAFKAALTGAGRPPHQAEKAAGPHERGRPGISAVIEEVLRAR